MATSLAVYGTARVCRPLASLTTFAMAEPVACVGVPCGPVAKPPGCAWAAPAVSPAIVMTARSPSWRMIVPPVICVGRRALVPRAAPTFHTAGDQYRVPSVTQRRVKSLPPRQPHPSVFGSAFAGRPPPGVADHRSAVDRPPVADDRSAIDPRAAHATGVEIAAAARVVVHLAEDAPAGAAGRAEAAVSHAGIKAAAHALRPRRLALAGQGGETAREPDAEPP